MHLCSPASPGKSCGTHGCVFVAFEFSYNTQSIVYLREKLNFFWGGTFVEITRKKTTGSSTQVPVNVNIPC